MLAWRMTADTAIKFYELCARFNAVTEHERLMILMGLRDEMISVTETQRTPEKYLADLAKNFKVLNVSGAPNAGV